MEHFINIIHLTQSIFCHSIKCKIGFIFVEYLYKMNLNLHRKQQHDEQNEKW
jgi:hypothetical protein